MSEKKPAIEEIAETTGRSVEEGLTSVAPPDGTHEQRKHRTWGNRVFDILVWPTIAFGAVFGFSVWATHEAKFGVGKGRKAFDWLEEKIEKSWFVRKSLPAEVRKEEANNQTLVAVSFIAGTILMAPIKWFEDARGKISQWLDKKHGTLHDDPDHYLKEPKQSWKSVLGGRAITFASVFMLSKALGDHIIDAAYTVANKMTGKSYSFAGLKEAEKMAIMKDAGRRWQFAFVSSFEAFYTALCAVSVYVISRGLARLFNKKDENVTVGQGKPAADQVPADTEVPGKASWQEKAAPPREPKRAENFVKSVEGSRSEAVAVQI